MSSNPDVEHLSPSPPPSSHPHSHSARQVLRHFLHPSGKRVHVAHSPEEAANLRKTLEREREGSAAAGSEEGYDVVLSGTPEHLEHLKTAKEHHEGRREELRGRHQVRFSFHSCVPPTINLQIYSLQTEFFSND
jgi:hypothetical protein